eukprot:14844281-Heterocapsa_arctica.AAC.1
MSMFMTTRMSSAMRLRNIRSFMLSSSPLSVATPEIGGGGASKSGRPRMSVYYADTGIPHG